MSEGTDSGWVSHDVDGTREPDAKRANPPDQPVNDLPPFTISNAPNATDGGGVPDLDSGKE